MQKGSNSENGFLADEIFSNFLWFWRIKVKGCWASELGRSCELVLGQVPRWDDMRWVSLDKKDMLSLLCTWYFTCLLLPMVVNSKARSTHYIGQAHLGTKRFRPLICRQDSPEPDMTCSRLGQSDYPSDIYLFVFLCENYPSFIGNGTDKVSARI